MALSKTEVNLRRLLATAPQQQNQSKLIHYVATLREQLEKLAEERTPDGLPRVSKGQLNDYSEKIEAIASKISTTEWFGGPLLTSKGVKFLPPNEPTKMGVLYPLSAKQVSQDPSLENSGIQVLPKPEEEDVGSPRGLRRRLVAPTENRSSATIKVDNKERPVKLDAAAHTHIQKHRKLQDELTDEMVDLARKLKESSLMMSQSIQNTEKILDSTETAVEQSLASTGRANTRAMEVYSQSFKTSCTTWIMIFVMTCIFVMVVLLIRVT